MGSDKNVANEAENNGKENMKPNTPNVVPPPASNTIKSLVKVTTGKSKTPEGDNQEDNVFLKLYLDPKTSAPKGRTIYLSRHGESLFNLFGKIGGNANLSAHGLKYAKKLADFFENAKLPDFRVWTSELVRTQETAQHIKAPKMVLKQLNEINSGEHDGMTYESIAEQYPVDFAKRDQDKLRYRYPNGESYVDVCRRLCEILPMMNQAQNLLVVSHQAVVRCLYTYLMKLPISELPYVKIPLHTIMKVTFDGEKNIMESTFMNIDCVDTHRVKPTNCNPDRDISDAIQTVPKHK